MGSIKSDTEIKYLKKHKNTRDSSSDSDSSLSSFDEQLKEKLLKKLKKLKKKEKKKKKKDRKKDRLREKSSKKEKKNIDKQVPVTENDGKSEKLKNFAPMTKEQWEKQQSTLRRIYDKETGRTRLIRGSGEIVEECVSRERQYLINKYATMKDGEYFQKVLSSSLK